MVSLRSRFSNGRHMLRRMYSLNLDSQALFLNIIAIAYLVVAKLDTPAKGSAAMASEPTQPTTTILAVVDSLSRLSRKSTWLRMGNQWVSVSKDRTWTC